jgi:hypothetical protein
MSSGNTKPQGTPIVENPTTVADMRRNGVTVGDPIVEDVEGIEAMYRRRDDAHKARDWEMLRDTIDFPVWMVTDSADTQAVTWYGDESKLLEVQANIMRLVPRTPVHHERRYVFLTSNLALNMESNTVMVGNEQVAFKAAHLVIRREDGKWRVKSVIEGGWGNVAKLFGTDFRVPSSTP